MTSRDVSGLNVLLHNLGIQSIGADDDWPEDHLEMLADFLDDMDDAQLRSLVEYARMFNAGEIHGDDFYADVRAGMKFGRWELGQLGWAFVNAAPMAEHALATGYYNDKGWLRIPRGSQELPQVVQDKLKRR